jgi:hypothetical protein
MDGNPLVLILSVAFEFSTANLLKIAVLRTQDDTNRRVMTASFGFRGARNHIQKGDGGCIICIDGYQARGGVPSGCGRAECDEVVQETFISIEKSRIHNDRPGCDQSFTQILHDTLRKSYLDFDAILSCDRTDVAVE